MKTEQLKDVERDIAKEDNGEYEKIVKMDDTKEKQMNMLTRRRPAENAEQPCDEMKANNLSPVETKYVKELNISGTDCGNADDKDEVGQLVEGLNKVKLTPHGPSDGRPVSHHYYQHSGVQESEKLTGRGPQNGQPVNHRYENVASNFQFDISTEKPGKRGNYCVYDYSEHDVYEQQPLKFVRPQNTYNPLPSFIANTTVEQRFHSVNVGGMTGGTTSIKTPDKQLFAPEFPTNSYVDDILDNIENSSFPDVPQIYPTQQLPVFVGGIMPMPSQTEMTKNGYGQLSDLESGVGSPGEQSPFSEFSEPASSPGSIYASPPSNRSEDSGYEHSGYEQSPKHYPFSPESISGHSPPKSMSSPPYECRVSPSPVVVPPSMSPGSHLQNHNPHYVTDVDNGTSAFINEHLDHLQMALEVLHKDIKETEEKKEKKRREQMKQSMTTAQVHSGTITKSVTMPANTTTVAYVSKSYSAVAPVPQTQTQAASAPVLILPQNPPTTSSSIMVVPSMPQPTGTVIVIQPQLPPKPKKLREIRPKIPVQPEGNVMTAANGQSAQCSTLASSKGLGHGSVIGQSNVVQQKPVQTQQNSQGTTQRLLNARRCVADIPREKLHAFDEEGDTHLHIAVCKSEVFIVQALLERLYREGLEHMVDHENKKRQTPLYLAVVNNQPAIVSLLIKAKANVNTLAQSFIPDRRVTEVKAAIHVASSHGREYMRTLQELLQAPDLNINISNNNGCTALFCALEAHGKPQRIGDTCTTIDSRPVIQELIRAGADTCAQDKKNGKTPLMTAIERKDFSLVECIIAEVKQPKLRNLVKTQAFDGTTCLKLAEGIQKDFDTVTWNKLWNLLQNCVNSGSQATPKQFQMT